jgi:hypothetical protein
MEISQRPWHKKEKETDSPSPKKLIIESGSTDAKVTDRKARVRFIVDRMLNPDAKKDAANLSETISSTGSGDGDNKSVELLDVNKKNVVQFASETELTSMAIPFDR